MTSDHTSPARHAAGPEPEAPDRPRLGEPVCLLTRGQVRAVDRLACDEFGIPSIVLMENASAALARETIRQLEQAGRGDALIVCGPGNNGGDGLTAARHLHNAGVRVRVALLCDPAAYTGDARTNLGITQKMGVPINAADIRAWNEHPPPGAVIDAIFGSGLDRDITGRFADAINAIERMHARGSRVIAADIPSGLDADTGRVLGVAVRADATVTFAGIKPGLLEVDAQQFVGELSVASIGCPGELLERLGTRLDWPRAGRSAGAV